MYKKILFAIAMLTVGVLVLGMTEPVQAADSHWWSDDYNDKALDDLPYYGGRVDLESANTPPWSLMGSLKDGTNFGEYQLFAVQPEDDVFLDDCDEEADSYVRVRIQASKADWDNIEEGAFAAKIWLDESGRPEIAGGVSNAEGYIDIVGMVPAGKTFGVTLGNVHPFSPDTDGWPEEFDTWITQGVNPGGGVIIDFREDLQGTATNRSIQFSTQEGVEPAVAYWQEDSFEELTPGTHIDPGSDPDWGGAQYWLDIPTGTYNLGVQQAAEGPAASDRPGDPFVHYVPDVEIGPNAFFGPLGYDEDVPDWIPGNTIFARLGATESLTVEIDECGPQVGEVFLNVVDGFLVDDLSPGWIHNPTDPQVIQANSLYFFINRGFRWDLAVVTDEIDGHHDEANDFFDNWFLVSLDFNPASDDLTFNLCETGAQYVQPTLDKDWDSALLELTPPGGNLNERWFDIDNGYERCDLDIAGSCAEALSYQYESENVFLFAKAGCCGEPGGFEAFVQLDHIEECPDGCCETIEQYPVNEPCALCGEAPAKTYYGFVPSEPLWDFELIDISEYYDCDPDPVCTYPGICLAPNYAPIFGDGPFTSDAGVSKLEYAVDELDGEVLHTRGPWMDAFGNKIEWIRQAELCVDFCTSDCCAEGSDVDDDGWLYVDLLPYYLLIENVTGEVLVDVEGWETTPLGPITDIGRYMYVAGLPHGYLNDIQGHETWKEVCCDLTGPCDLCGECEFDYDCCEDPHYADEVVSLYAISPADLPMTRWSWSWVMAMYEWDLTNGIDGFNYGPALPVTRDQMAAFLGRLATDVYGLAPLGTAEQFADVPMGHFAYDAILLLRDYNITNGIDGVNFGPGLAVTRAQMAKFLQQFFKTIEAYKGDVTWWDTRTNTASPYGFVFEDVGTDNWAVAYIEEMFEDTLTDGCRIEDGDMFFCPNDVVTREQMAKFIMRAVETDDVTQGFWPVLAPEK